MAEKKIMLVCGSWYVNQYVSNADAKGRRKRWTFGSYFCYSCL